MGFGNQTLYAVRELNLGRLLFAEPLLSSARDEVRGLFERAHEIAARLGKPVRAWMSDKQDAFLSGVAAVFPGVPHRYCQNHFLRDAAKPMLETDSHAKVQMRRKVRGLRDIERSVAKDHASKMLFAGIGGNTVLEQEIIAAALERTFLGGSLPMAQQDFAKRCDEGRSRLTLIAQEIHRLAGSILAEHATVQKKIAAIAKGFPAVAEDVKQQCARLLQPDFLSQTPWERLQHFPRYLKAAALRLEKLRADPARDLRPAAELAPLHSAWQREDALRRRSGHASPEIEQFRWLLEELRVALFGQELKTSVPVSVKRLAKLWQSIRTS